MHDRALQRLVEKDQQIEALKAKVAELTHRVFGRKSERGRYATFYAVMFALLLIPKGYIHLPHANQATIQIILNPLIMVSMILAIIWERLRSPIREIGPEPIKLLSLS